MVRSSSTWFAASMPTSFVSDFLVDVGDRLLGALAEVPGLDAVTQLHRFVFARGGAGRNSGAPEAAVGQHYIGFHGRVAARVQNFSANDFYDFRHVCPLEMRVIE